MSMVYDDQLEPEETPMVSAKSSQKEMKKGFLPEIKKSQTTLAPIEKADSEKSVSSKKSFIGNLFSSRSKTIQPEVVKEPIPE